MVLGLLLAAFGFGSSAAAGDIATLEPIGFSQDGDLFAYQESGIQDGSGFPYAHIFVLDLNADRFVDPSPVRVLLKDEAASVADAMSEARAMVAMLLAERLADPRKGEVVVENLPTDLSADPKTARFVPRAILPPIDDPIELRLSTFALQGPEFCEAETRGFRLARIALVAGAATSVLHEDTGIPVSRSCPLDYGIRQVRIYEKPSGGFAGVALLTVTSRGFEGPDIRHIALPVPLD
ncbi:DUF2259 domain-containing protein [Fulvimarina sp. 2208YS6-2-32]|uniref:DUF2259 domain-containing protein n=1 Tax=Fulvimarina uroteuthidis TaxID=3098149 RepID=A0ABU5I0R4_9HYPH|nr:DUF2259 domain-containing protein [Fulvimarina sp. 2208YS6-2-32]MDY8108399.1 DUF2259 domain-containing protein [Fulvimarina sp. 2208YS6-2-32]